jgi:hypothetical protein
MTAFSVKTFSIDREQKTKVRNYRKCVANVLSSTDRVILHFGKVVALGNYVTEHGRRQL